MTSTSTPKTTQRRWMPIILLTLVIIGVQVIIDILLGTEAEYFNAWATLVQLTYPFHRQTIDAPMIYGESDLGIFALPLATIVMVGVPLIIATLLVSGWRVLRRGR